MVGDGTGVGHDLHRILKNIFIDPLQDIFSAGVGIDLQRVVDMSVAETNAGDRLTVDPEGIGCLSMCMKLHLKNNCALSAKDRSALWTFIIAHVTVNCK
jgi:hypothetical protein